MRRGEMKDFLINLLGIDSTSGKWEEIGQAMQLFEEKAREEGLDVLWSEDPMYLIVGRGDLLKPDIGFLCHLDVVPPFKPPRIEGDRVYGRGSIDMKGPTVACFFAMLESDHDSVALALTGDEETAGDTAALLSTRFVPKKVLLVPDQNRDFDVTLESKGIIELEVAVEGLTAHGSTPWNGINAVEKAVDVWGELKTILEVNNDEGVWSNTLNLSFINTSNTAHNVVPGEAKIGFDFRFMEESAGYWEKRIKEAVRELDVQISHLAKGERIDVDPTSELELFMEVTEKITKTKPLLLKNTSSCDARFYQNKVPTIIITKCAGGKSHHPEEYVDYESMEDMKTITRIYLEKLREDGGV